MTEQWFSYDNLNNFRKDLITELEPHILHDQDDVSLKILEVVDTHVEKKDKGQLLEEKVMNL